MLNQHVMIDLETMGVQADSVILSIGAVTFDKNGVHKEFYCNVDFQSCLDAGMTITNDTFYWWLSQSEKAGAILSKDRKSITEALNELTSWMKAVGMVKGVWGNGASFDNTLLNTSYHKVLSSKAPWPFWNDRCFRTIKGMLPRVPDSELPPIGTAHNALDDARHQARYLIAACEKAGNLIL